MYRIQHQQSRWFVLRLSLRRWSEDQTRVKVSTNCKQGKLSKEMSYKSVQRCFMTKQHSTHKILSFSFIKISRFGKKIMTDTTLEITLVVQFDEHHHELFNLSASIASYFCLAQFDQEDKSQITHQIVNNSEEKLPRSVIQFFLIKIPRSQGESSKLFFTRKCYIKVFLFFFRNLADTLGLQTGTMSFSELCVCRLHKHSLHKIS